MPSTSNRLRTIHLHIRIGFCSMRSVSITRCKLLVSPRLVNLSDELSPPWKDYSNRRGVDDVFNSTTSSNSDAFLLFATTRKPNCKSTASLWTKGQRKCLSLFIFQSVLWRRYLTPQQQKYGCHWQNVKYQHKVLLIQQAWLPTVLVLNGPEQS